MADVLLGNQYWHAGYYSDVQADQAGALADGAADEAGLVAIDPDAEWSWKADGAVVPRDELIPENTDYLELVDVTDYVWPE